MSTRSDEARAAERCFGRNQSLKCYRSFLTTKKKGISCKRFFFYFGKQIIISETNVSRYCIKK